MRNEFRHYKPCIFFSKVYLLVVRNPLSPLCVNPGYVKRNISGGLQFSVCNFFFVMQPFRF